MQCAKCNQIYVENFDELIQSGQQSVNGDTINIINDLTSDSSIGNSYYTKDVTFQGANHIINGGNIFGGFVLSQGSNFNQIKIDNCKGQIYNNSYFAGAIFNTGGTTLIENSAFDNNHADASSFNYAVAGAIYNTNNGNINIGSSLFENNYTNGASAQGGAIGNDNGNGTINITNSIFNNNFTNGSAVSYGGAISNGNNATVNISNTLFNNNYGLASDRSAYLYGGSIYNTGNLNIDNCYFSNNHLIGDTDSFSYGGAIHNNLNLSVKNSIFENNYINSDIDSSGGAIYNYLNGNAIIENSTFRNNYLDAQNSRGGAIGNEGILTIINSNFYNNSDTNGANDIYNQNTLNFAGSGTTNILSGIRGNGTINKYGSGILNLGGNNSNYTGSFNIEEGTVNVLANSEYFNATSTSFGNFINFNLQNGQIDNINLGALTLKGQSNVYPDVNFFSNTMDRINANTLSGNGTILVPNLAIYGTPKSNFISISFANSVIKNSVKYYPRIIETPIYDYLSSYNPSNGNFIFLRNGFNAGILASQVAMQLAGYLTQIDTYNNIFSNLDMVMLVQDEQKISLYNHNKIAYIQDGGLVQNYNVIPEQNKGVWFKPYSTFETVGLKNGPEVSNVGYGGLIGAESTILSLKKNWKWLYGGYASYNGSHQAYEGIGIYNNGGMLGINAAFYKNNFFTLWTASAGANTARASENYGANNTTMLNAGIAQKSGWNIPIFKNKVILQPSIMTSYTFVNTFDYTTPSSVYVNTKPLNAIHIEPQIKIIGNFKNLLQPYAGISVAWNILDTANFKANDVYLPELSVKPYVRYGLGIQKRISDYFTGFAQAYITNGGRNGIGLQCGFRWSIGKDKKNNSMAKNSTPQLPKTKIALSSMINKN